MPRRLALPKDPRQRAEALLNMATGMAARPAELEITEHRNSLGLGAWLGGAKKSPKKPPPYARSLKLLDLYQGFLKYHPDTRLLCRNVSRVIPLT
jgi:hypothetical protein